MFLLRFFRSLSRIAAGKMYVLLRFLRVSVENSRKAMCFLVGSRSDCGMIFFALPFCSFLTPWVVSFSEGEKKKDSMPPFFSAWWLFVEEGKCSRKLLLSTEP